MRIEMTEIYRDWQNRLKDLTVRARIQARITRLAMGNPGQHRVLTGGVCELKLDFGAGYRVYYTERGNTLIVLLAGGDKRTVPTKLNRPISGNSATFNAPQGARNGAEDGKKGETNAHSGVQGKSGAVGIGGRQDVGRNCAAL